MSIDSGIKFWIIVSNKYGVDEIFSAVVCECLVRRMSISKAHDTPTGGGCISFRMYLQIVKNPINFSN